MKKKHSQSRDLFLEKAYYTANKPGSFGGINRFKSLLKSKKKIHSSHCFQMVTITRCIHTSQTCYKKISSPSNNSKWN